MKKLIVLFIAIIGFLMIVSPASASTLNLSPGSGEIGLGQVFSVGVRLNTQGEAVNAVSAFLSYDKDKLEVAWVSVGSAFAIEAEKSYGGGVVKISRGSVSGVTGNVNVATIGFKGKAQGVANVTYIGGSAVPRASDSTDSLNLGGSSGGKYTVVQKTASQEASKTKSLQISDVQVFLVTRDSAVITWKTDQKSDSTVEYGLEKDKYILSATVDDQVTDHRVTLENPLLTPGVTYHFRVRSKDTKGNLAQGQDMTFKLNGYQAKIKVTDSNNKPQTDVLVLLSQNKEIPRVKTNTQGEAIFNELTLGSHLVVMKFDNQEKSQEINLTEDNQEFTVVIKRGLSWEFLNTPVIYTIPVIILIAVGVLMLIIIRRRNKTPTIYADGFEKND